MLRLFGFDRAAWTPFVLKGLQAHVDGDTDRNRRRERRRLMDLIRRDEDMRDIVTTLAVLEYGRDEVLPDEPVPPVEGGRFGETLLKILQWFASPEGKAFLEWIISLFAGLSGGASLSELQALLEQHITPAA